MVEINKYWRLIFLVPWCKTYLTCKAVSQAPPTNENSDLPECLKNAFPRRFCFPWALYFNFLESELGNKVFDQI